MTIINRFVTPVLLGTLMLLVTFGGVQAAPAPAKVRLHTTPMAGLTITIATTGGTVWGKVFVRFMYQHKHMVRVCTRARCHFALPRGVVVHLSQQPTSASTWPFKVWQIKVMTKGATPRAIGKKVVALKMTSNFLVRAVYVVA